MSCGLVAIGSCNDVLADSLIQLMMEAEEEELNNTYMRLVALGLALLYLGEDRCCLGNILLDVNILLIVVDFKVNRIRLRLSWKL